MAQACACEAPHKLDRENPRPDTSAIIAAGGIGERFHDPKGKQFVQLAGMPLAAWAILAFANAPSVAEIVVVCSPDKRDRMHEQVVDPLKLSKPVVFADAGEYRQDSCRAGVRASDPNLPIVAIHDAARPLIAVQTIEDALAVLRANTDLDGVVCAKRAVDTLKLCEDDTIVATPDRTQYWQAQTPQIFRRATALEAHESAFAAEIISTDDSALVERIGGKVKCFATEWGNLKVTVPEDLIVAEAILTEHMAADALGREFSA